jgi:hypothetical protein
MAAKGTDDEVGGWGLPWSPGGERAGEPSTFQLLVLAFKNIYSKLISGEITRRRTQCLQCLCDPV